jgi:hypothetical protein
MSTNDSTPIVTPPPKPNRQISTKDNNANDPDRFKYGVLLRGKLIGVEDVKEETGDEVCQLSMIKLKAVVLAKKEHKQRICININLDGIEIVDEKTNQSIYKHAVNRISYIARDANDPRAIGYIYKTGNNSYQYFAIKTERQAQELFNTLKELFEEVLRLKNAKNDETTPTAKTEEKPVVAATTTQPVENNSTTHNNQPTASSTNNDLLSIDSAPVEAVKPQAQTSSSNNLLDEFADIPTTTAPVLSTTPPKNALNTATPPQASSNDLEGLFDLGATQTPASSPVTGSSQLLSNLNSLYSQPSPQTLQQPPRLPPFPPQQPNYNPNPFGSGMNPMMNSPNPHFNPSSFGSMQQPQQPPPLPSFPNQFNNFNPLAAQQQQFQQNKTQQPSNTSSMQFPW